MIKGAELIDALPLALARFRKGLASSCLPLLSMARARSTHCQCPFAVELGFRFSTAGTWRALTYFKPLIHSRSVASASAPQTSEPIEAITRIHAGKAPMLSVSKPKRAAPTVVRSEGNSQMAKQPHKINAQYRNVLRHLRPCRGGGRAAITLEQNPSSGMYSPDSDKSLSSGSRLSGVF